MFSSVCFSAPTPPTPPPALGRIHERVGLFVFSHMARVPPLGTGIDTGLEEE